jgi:hypothetical protein
VELCLHSSSTPSWLGAQLKAEGQLYLYSGVINNDCLEDDAGNGWVCGIGNMRRKKPAESWIYVLSNVISCTSWAQPHSYHLKISVSKEYDVPLSQTC